MKSVIGATFLLLAGCGGGQEELNEVELTKAAAELSNEANMMVNRQANEIMAEDRAAEQTAKSTAAGKKAQ